MRVIQVNQRKVMQNRSKASERLLELSWRSQDKGRSTGLLNNISFVNKERSSQGGKNTVRSRLLRGRYGEVLSEMDQSQNTVPLPSPH